MAVDPDFQQDQQQTKKLPPGRRNSRRAVIAKNLPQLKAKPVPGRPMMMPGRPMGR